MKKIDIWLGCLLNWHLGCLRFGFPFPDFPLINWLWIHDLPSLHEEYQIGNLFLPLYCRVCGVCIIIYLKNNRCIKHFTWGENKHIHTYNCIHYKPYYHSYTSLNIIANQGSTWERNLMQTGESTHIGSLLYFLDPWSTASLVEGKLLSIEIWHWKWEFCSS